ncbi:nucleotidyltransferase domain-containing protein [Streptomyces sp. WZ-12]|uniref:nucleotidyltransferase domain-containing protein n=1 Tax=Streptomyces sp. WZ-12 TaxID=3030210 RepID=UPI00238120CE|nr:amino acid transporter [Streptomyces sp. WZ-12]
MRHLQAPFGRWEPAPPSEVRERFGGPGVRWWVAGGRAIELAVGRGLRPHGDVDVLLLRRDQLTVQQALAGWEWWAADPPGSLRPWARGEELPSGVHDIWCRPGPDRPWRIQVMLDESAGAEWVSRRDSRVRRPIEAVAMISPEGIPFLAPEIQLYYKAKAPSPKDEADFAAALPVLMPRQRHWLAGTITRSYGEPASAGASNGAGPGHPWVGRLRTRTRPGAESE